MDIDGIASYVGCRLAANSDSSISARGILKLLMLSLAMGQLLAFVPQGLCQEKQPAPNRPYLEHKGTPRLHFVTPSGRSTGRVELTASSAQRDLKAPRGLSSAEVQSVLQLRGNVEVMMCSRGSHGCDHGSMVLHADTVDYNEQTHELDARGDVRIKPYRDQPKNEQ
jgi:hypothetical protein